MSTNPYAYTGLPAAQSPAAARATFLTKVYSLVLAGVMTFAATMWAAGNVPAVHDLMAGLWNLIHGSRGRWIVYSAIMMGGFWLVHAVSRRTPINLIAYFAWTVLLGLLTAPLVLFVAKSDPGTLNAAAAITALIFTGLTAIVLVTGKDFSFLRGALMLLFWGLFVYAIASWIWGFETSTLYPSLLALLFAGYILYDTSNILHRYPTDMAVSAAVELFTDVAYLFRQVLVLMMRRD